MQFFRAWMTYLKDSILSYLDYILSYFQAVKSIHNIPLPLHKRLKYQCELFFHDVMCSEIFSRFLFLSFYFYIAINYGFKSGLMVCVSYIIGTLTGLSEKKYWGINKYG